MILPSSQKTAHVSISAPKNATGMRDIHQRDLLMIWCSLDVPFSTISKGSGQNKTRYDIAELKNWIKYQFYLYLIDSKFQLIVNFQVNRSRLFSSPGLKAQVIFFIIFCPTFVCLFVFPSVCKLWCFFFFIFVYFSRTT